MSVFRADITTENAAFYDGDDGDDGRSEVARILRGLAEKIDNEPINEGLLRDYNGNPVGTFEFSEE